MEKLLAQTLPLRTTKVKNGNTTNIIYFMLLASTYHNATQNVCEVIAEKDHTNLQQHQYTNTMNSVNIEYKK